MTYKDYMHLSKNKTQMIGQLYDDAQTEAAAADASTQSFNFMTAAPGRG